MGLDLTEAVKRDDLLKEAAWRVAEIWIDAFEVGGVIDPDHLLTIKQFVRELGIDDTISAMDIAVSRMNRSGAAFRYFCGICWNKIKS